VCVGGWGGGHGGALWPVGYHRWEGMSLVRRENFVEISSGSGGAVGPGAEGAF
jgi:hypothetical protein